MLLKSVSGFAAGTVITVMGFGLLVAQTFNAGVQGVISDQTGAVVPNAAITIVNEQTNVRQNANSDQVGRYRLLNLPPGVYRVSVEVKGFQTFIRTGMEMQVNQNVGLDVVLTPGDVNSSVTVTGEAPRLDTQDASLGRVVDNKSLLNMPLTTRDPLGLVTLAPGISGSAGANTGTNFSANGGRNSQADVLIDGMSITMPEGGISIVEYRPSVEAIQEFKVQTNSFSAEFGNSGTAVVNMVMRSGGNQVHGSVFEFLRNSDMNSNAFFSNRAGKPLASFQRNTFGGAVGGPVVLPHLYHGKDRTFFFVNFEEGIQSAPITQLDTVPTLDQRNGDFSKSVNAQGQLIAIYNPYSGGRDASGNWIRAPFPNNVVPQSLFNAVGANMVGYYALPNTASTSLANTNNHFGSGAKHQTDRQLNAKVDHSFNERNRLSVRYGLYTDIYTNDNLWGNQMNPYDTGAVGTAPGVLHTAEVDHTATLSPTTILNLRWGVHRQWGYSWPYKTDFTGQDAKDLGFTGPTGAQLAPQFGAEEYQSVGTKTTRRIVRGYDMNQLLGSLSKVHGAHTFKFGGDAHLYRANNSQPGVDTTAFNFSRITTSQNPLVTNTLQGNAIASMLLGFGSSGVNTTGTMPAVASQSLAAYVTDDWLVSKGLTLSLGLRYERDLPRTERYNRLNWFDPSVKSPLNVPAFPNLSGGLVFATPQNRSPFPADTLNFAPRSSLAWQFHPHYVVRAGYGIYYGLGRGGSQSLLGEGFTTTTAWQPSLDSGMTPYATLQNPFPNGINKPIGSSQGLLTGVGRGISNVVVRDWGAKPYNQQWNVSLERELPGNSVVELAYTGSRGVHLYNGALNNINLADPSANSYGTRLSDMLPNPFYGVITDPTSPLSQPTINRFQLMKKYPQYTSLASEGGPPVGNSVYHAAFIRFTHRFSQGISLTAHYTRSKMIDDSSFAYSTAWLGGNTAVQSPLNMGLERAVSTWDIPNRAVVDFTYAIPFGRSRHFGAHVHPVVDGVLGGWEINSFLTWQSGAPLAPALSGSTLADGSQRPNLIGDPNTTGSAESRLNTWLNASAFSRPAPYTFGTAPRTLSMVRAQSLKNADATVSKYFYPFESHQRNIQLRAEAFNLTNTPIFGAPNMSFGGSSFGVVSTQANAPRELQFALKLGF